MFSFFKKRNKVPLPYLDRIEELEHVTIIRLKGRIDQAMVPVIEARIQENRRAGSKIDKNVLVDYALVEKVDSAAVAFHFFRLKEYEAKGYKVGFVHMSKDLCTYLKMFKLTDQFRLYGSEEEALKELNQ